MIIAKLQGGLGNQMFQYAAGKALAHKLQTSLKLDILQYQNDKLRKYALNCFELETEFATENELRKFYNYKQKPIWHKKLRQLIILEENPIPSFVPDYFTVKGNIFLSGYWQSEIYFQDIDQIIRNDFKFRTHKTNSYQEKIQSTNSASIHIRRGDYISNDVTNEFHGTCSLDYYSQAVDQLCSKVESLNFFVFSDDIEWCKINLDGILSTRNCTFIENTNDTTDLQLMTNCKHNIIANSSFSWWGAWLNTNKGKIVIAPQKWFNDPGINTLDLIPESWLRL